MKRSVLLATVCFMCTTMSWSQNSDVARCAQSLTLSEEFYEAPLEKPFDKHGNMLLNVIFQYGSASLIGDYTQTKDSLKMMMYEVKHYGDKLVDPTITVYASPDGNPDKNKELAMRRASVVRRDFFPQINNIRTNAVVCTWEDVAKELEIKGYSNEASAVRNAIVKAKDSAAITSKVRSSVGSKAYRDIVTPVLSSMHRVVFTYTIIGKRIESPKEALSLYLQNGGKTIHGGDLYMLLSTIEDEMVRDVLVENSYNQMIETDKKTGSNIAPYLMNQMAVLRIKDLKPDTMILKPLIYEENGMLVLNKRVSNPQSLYATTMNRSEAIVNQAIMHYLFGDVRRAKWYVKQLDDNGYHSDALEKFRVYLK